MSTLIEGPKIITDGLIIYMDVANSRCYSGSGVTWIDLINNVNTGILTNGAVYENTNNGCIVTDGTNDYITVPIANVTNAFSINIWVKPIANSHTGAVNYMGLVQRFNGFAGQKNRFLLSTSFNFFLFQATVSGIDYNIISDNFSSIQNQISMCTITYDGSLVKFYLNGVSVLATPFSLTGTLTNGSSIPYLGWGATSTDYYMDGKFYTYQVYNKALSSSEVLQNYNALKGRFGY